MRGTMLDSRAQAELPERVSSVLTNPVYGLYVMSPVAPNLGSRISELGKAKALRKGYFTRFFFVAALDFSRKELFELSPRKTGELMTLRTKKADRTWVSH